MVYVLNPVSYSIRETPRPNWGDDNRSQKNLTGGDSKLLSRISHNRFEHEDESPPSKNRSSMHRCLEVNEILQNIFCFIPDQQVRSRRWSNALLNVALVRRAFTNPAMSLLWEKLTSLVRLIRILPRDLFHICPDGASTGGRTGASFLPKRELVCERVFARIEDIDATFGSVPDRRPARTPLEPTSILRLLRSALQQLCKRVQRYSISS